MGRKFYIEVPMSQSQSPAQEAKKSIGIIRPYGDRLDDGIAQTAFVLPVPPSARAKEAARELMHKMGYIDTKIATMEKAAQG